MRNASKRSNGALMARDWISDSSTSSAVAGLFAICLRSGCGGVDARSSRTPLLILRAFLRSDARTSRTITRSGGCGTLARVKLRRRLRVGVMLGPRSVGRGDEHDDDAGARLRTWPAHRAVAARSP